MRSRAGGSRGQVASNSSRCVRDGRDGESSSEACVESADAESGAIRKRIRGRKSWSSKGSNRMQIVLFREKTSTVRRTGHRP